MGGLANAQRDEIEKSGAFLIQIRRVELLGRSRASPEPDA
jgi:hypothetical protein